MHNQPISTLEEYITCLAERLQLGNEYVFRGQSDVKWDVTSSAARRLSPADPLTVSTDEFEKWLSESMKFRGKGLAVAGLLSLCFVSSYFAPLAGFATATWLGEVNKRWVERKSSQDAAFRFISKVDGKIRKLGKK